MFPPPDRQQHDPKPSEQGILSQEVTDTEYEVRDVVYRVHTKRDAPPAAPKTMRVIYRLGLNHWQSEFVCLEHSGYPRVKAVQWWRERSPEPVPDTAERAVEIADAGGLAYPERITVRSIAGEPHARIIHCVVGPMPESLPTFESADGDAEVPF